MRRLVLVLVALLLNAACAGDDDDVASSSSTTATPTTVSRAGLVHLAPGDVLPGGLTFVDATVHPGPAEPHARGGVLIGRGTGDGWNELVLVTFEDETDRQTAGADREQVDVNGASASLRRDGDGTTVEWVTGKTFITVETAAPDRDDLVLAVANAVHAASRRVTALPEGFVEIASSSEPADAAPGWNVTLASEQNATGLVTIDGRLVGEGVSPALEVGATDTLVKVDVRGTEGYAGGRALVAQDQNGSVSFTTLAWRESPTTMITIRGTSTVEELLGIAEGLRVVSEAELTG